MSDSTKQGKSVAKSADLRARIRLAAALSHLSNATDSALAEQVGEPVDTIIRWKGSREWEEVLQEIASKKIMPTLSPMLALTLFERQALQTALPNASRETREKAARALLDLGKSGVSSC